MKRIAFLLLMVVALCGCHAKTVYTESPDADLAKGTPDAKALEGPVFEAKAEEPEPKAEPKPDTKLVGWRPARLREILYISGRAYPGVTVFDYRRRGSDFTFVMNDVGLGGHLLIENKLKIAGILPFEKVIFQGRSPEVYLPEGFKGYKFQNPKAFLVGSHKVEFKAPIRGLGTTRSYSFDELLMATNKYNSGATYYRPDMNMIRAIAQSGKKVEVHVFFGTWCRDCDRDLPKAVRVIQELRKLNATNVEFTFWPIAARDRNQPNNREFERKGRKPFFLLAGYAMVNGVKHDLYTNRDHSSHWTTPEASLYRIVVGR